MKIKLLSYSAASNKQSARKLRYQGDHLARPAMCVANMVDEGAYQMVSVRDISKQALDKLEPEMSVRGYRMAIHPDWNEIKEKWRYSALQVLFYKDVDFRQMTGDEEYETTLRCIRGTFHLAGEKIYYRSEHVPAVDDQKGKVSEQIKRKEKQLEAAEEFQNTYNARLALSEGDYNGNGKEGTDCYCKKVYERFCFRDLVDENTYENQQLDSVYVSKGLKESKIKVTATVRDDWYMQMTDHKMLEITLEAES